MSQNAVHVNAVNTNCNDQFHTYMYVNSCHSCYTYVVVTGCLLFFPPWLLSDSCQAHYGLGY